MIRIDAGWDCVGAWQIRLTLATLQRPLGFVMRGRRLIGMLASGLDRGLGAAQRFGGPVASLLGALKLAGRTLGLAARVSFRLTCGSTPLGSLLIVVRPRPGPRA